MLYRTYLYVGGDGFDSHIGSSKILAVVRLVGAIVNCV